LLRGGIAPRDVAKAVRITGARVVHAHNLNPMFGWRALAAARSQGARIVLHLHQYRLVCATGVCFTDGQECTRCHARNTLPGVIHNCRGSRSEALAYGASLALWQRRLVAQADAVIVPSVFARERLRELGAPLDFERVYVLAPPVSMAGDSDDQDRDGKESDVQSSAAIAPGRGSQGPHAGTYALVVSRLAPEKGVDVAIDACRLAGVPLVIAGDGPEQEALRARAVEGDVRFVGRIDDAELKRLRAGAALAIVPSRSAETFGMAAAEAMAAAVPVVASRIGALPELVEQASLVDPGDSNALAQAIERLWGDRSVGARGQERVRELCAPGVSAEGLARVYDAVSGPTAAPLR
jgi:glycosyltransferase involved in cell wall biosynthesis